MSNDNVKVGLGAAVTGFGQLSADDLRDLMAVFKLREKLNELAPEGSSSRGFDRQHIVSIFRVIAEAVGAIMDKRLTHGDGVIVIEHSITRLVADLAVALEDLDKGVVDEWVRPRQSLGSAKYNARERVTIRFCVDVVDSFQAAKRSTVDAAVRLAWAYLKKKGFRIRGREITAKDLKNWRRQPPGSR